MPGTVPKFGSFKPKVEHATKEREPDDKPAEDQPRSRHRSHRAHRPAGENVDKELQDVRQRVDTPQASPVKLQHGFTEKLFSVDRKGDSDNARYGSNSQWQVPRYREPLERSLVGVGRVSGGRIGGSLLAKLSHEDRKQLMSSGRLITAKGVSPSNYADGGLSEDFIPLRSSSRQSKSSSRMQVLGIVWNEQKSESSSDSDQDSPEEEAQDRYGPGNFLQQKIRGLQDRVKKTPSDLDSWLELVDLQETWVREGLSNESPLSGLQLRSTVTSLRLDLIGDALKAIGSDVPKQQILGLRRLAIGRLIWEHDVLSREWLHFLEKFGRSLPALEAYIFYRQSSAEEFEWEQIRDLYKELFRLHAGTSTDKEICKDLPRHALAVTSFLRDSGHRESAVAVWQASIYASLEEVRLQETTAPSEETDVAAFWDSELPRPGEQGSLSLSSPRISPDSSPSQGRKQDLNAWAHKELTSMNKAWIPGRTEDEDDGDEDDAYRIVLYPDIDVFVKKWESPEVLLNNFLLFCGLPPIFIAEEHKHYMPPDQSQLARSIQDNLVRTGSQKAYLLPSQSWLADAQCLFCTEDCVYASFRDVSKEDVLARMAANILEQKVSATIGRRPQDGDMVEYFFALLYHLDPSVARKKVRDVLDGGRSRCMRIYLCLALIELRSKGAAKADAVFVAAIKMCVHVQKEQPSEQLRLWNAWIWAALGDGNKALALDRILSIALENSPADLVQHETASQAQIIKTQNLLRQVRDDALTNQSWSEALQAAKLLTTLAFLTTLNISSTAAAFSANIAYFSNYVADTSPIMVALHQHLALLFHSHVTLRLAPYSPDSLAKALAPSISSLPSNGLLLTVYAEVFAHGTRLDDRVRSIARRILHVEAHSDLDSVQQKSQPSDMRLEERDQENRQSIVPKLFAIQSELSRQAELGSTSSSIRAIFERSLEDGGHGQCQAIWALYLDYESCVLDTVQQQSANQTKYGSDRGQRRLAAELSAAQDKVKGIFYRGLHALPGSKDWVMRAFTLRNMQLVLTAEERGLLVERIIDRGLRLHAEPSHS